MSRGSSARDSSTHWHASTASAASDTMSWRLCSNTRASSRASRRLTQSK